MQPGGEWVVNKWAFICVAGLFLSFAPRVGAQEKSQNVLEHAQELVSQSLSQVRDQKTDVAIHMCQKVLSTSKSRNRRIAAWSTLSLIRIKEKDFDRALYLLDRMEDEVRLKEIENGYGKNTKEIVVQENDTASKLAKRAGMSVALMQTMNPSTKLAIVAGQKLRVIKEPFSIMIDTSDRLLELNMGDKRIKTYSCATGAEDSTPKGDFTIANKVESPTWYKPGKVVEGGDPKNLLGSRWMGLSIKGYGIHGTTLPASIGYAASSGCIRMQNRDAEELFDLVPIGTPVTIRS
jgi:lipoprotein-anchoring transpeptidase ErfK/SrfK